MIQMMGPPLRALFDIHNLQHNTPPNDIYLLEYDRSIRNDNFRRSVGTVSRDWTVRRRSVEVPYPGLMSVRPSWNSSGSFFSLRTSSSFQVEPAAAKIRTRRLEVGYFCCLDSFVFCFDNTYRTHTCRDTEYIIYI